MAQFRSEGWLAFAGLLAVIMPGDDCVQILSMAVPEAVEAGSGDIVLDCDFEYTEEEKMQLDIKWYFNNEPEPIYQWIPSQKGPQLISELFKDHLNLEYEINEDSFKKHRALHIKNPLPQFSGTYMCKVSSFVDEDFDQKDLLIYAPPSSIKFSEMLLSGSEPLNVTCIASGMYPQPNASLTWGHNSSESEQVQNDPAVTIRDDGLVDIVLSTLIANKELDVITVIGCQISLPGTEFSIQEQTVFYPLGLEPTEVSTVEETTVEMANVTVDPVWMEVDNDTTLVEPTEVSTVDKITVEMANVTVDPVWMDVDNDTTSGSGECERSGACECEEDGSGGGGCVKEEDYTLDPPVEGKKEEEDRPHSGASQIGVFAAMASIFTAAMLSYLPVNFV